MPRSGLHTVAGRALAARGASVVLAASVSLVAGCYSYKPLAVASVPARTEVRLVFSAEGARQLREAAGFEMRQLDGIVVRTLADTAVLMKPSALITVDGDELPWRRGDLLVPWRTVAQSQQRTFDKRRSRGFAAVMGAVFTGVVYFALKSIAGGGGATAQSGGGVPE